MARKYVLDGGVPRRGLDERLQRLHRLQRAPDALVAAVMLPQVLLQFVVRLALPVPLLVPWAWAWAVVQGEPAAGLGPRGRRGRRRGGGALLEPVHHEVVQPLQARHG